MYLRLIGCLLATLLSLQGSVTASEHLNMPPFRQSPPQVEYYHGFPGHKHSARFHHFLKMGYRPTSLSSYGPPDDARYSAIWVHEPLGPDLQMIHDVPKPVFDSWVEKLRKRNYVLTHVTATGAEEEAIFAGVMEEDRKPNKPVWTLDCGIKNWKPFVERTELGLKMKTQGFSSYGTPDNRRYCILRHENRGNENVALYADLQEEDFQRTFAGEITKPFWRPKKLFMSNDLKIAGLFTDTSVGDWYSDTHLNETALEATIKEQTSKGLILTDIQGGVHEDVEFYNVIFQELLEPKTRHWQVTGKKPKYRHWYAIVKGIIWSPRKDKSLDSIMEKFMKTNGVRQAQVAIASRGVIKAERAYTWAEDDRETVATNDTFLLASVSKMFTAAAIDHLINSGKLSLGTKVYKRLGYFDAKDERANDITVKHLLDHKGGYDRLEAGEDISLGFNKVTMSLPTKGNRTATARDVIEYMLAQPLQFTPGEREAYSNYGFMLLGYLVSNVTGMPYMDFLEKNIFRGLDVEQYKTSPYEHWHDRIIQESRLTGLDTLRPMSNRSVAAVYGGYGAIMEECNAAFSLKASASTIAKFAGSHAVSGIGRRKNGYRRGSFEGARTHVESNGDFDFAVVLNTRDFAFDQEFEDLTENQIRPLLDGMVPQYPGTKNKKWGY